MFPVTMFQENACPIVSASSYFLTLKHVRISLSALDMVNDLLNKAIEQHLIVNKSYDLLNEVIDKLNDIIDHSNSSMENSTLATTLTEDNQAKLNKTLVPTK